MNGSGLALLAAGALALAGASRRGGRSVPSVPPEVLEEAREASEVFRKNARAWMKGMSKDVLKEDYELNWHESELRDLFGRRLLGYGTYRLALASRDRRFIVKLSMVPAQNLREARAWRDAGPKTKEILVPVLAFDPKGHWLVMERVVPYADPEDHWSPSIRALVQRAREVGVEDVRAENISSDFRVLDYGQAKSLKGSPDRNSEERLERLLEVVRKYKGEYLDMPEAWRPFLRDMKEAGFESLGSGGTRYVYALDADRVVKIDYDPDGSSNDAEYDAWRDFSRMGGGDLLVPVLGLREDGRVLIMARAALIPKGRIKEISSARRALILPREEAEFDFNWGLHEGVVKLLDYAS